MTDEQNLNGGMHRRDFLAKAGTVGAAVAAAPLLAPAAASASRLSDRRRSASRVLSVRTWGAYTGTLDPPDLPTYLEFQTLAPCYEGLLAWKPGTTDPVNCLAESFVPSKDGLSYKFTLKKGIQFHRGYGEVTAQDVAFSLLRARDSKLNRDPSTKSIADISVTGKYTGVIRMNQIYAPFATAALERWNNAIVSQRAVEELGDKFRLTPVLTGPYFVDSFDPTAGKVVLKRFANYRGASKGYQHLGNVDEIRYTAIVDDNTAEVALGSGDLNFSWLGPDAASRVKAAGKFPLTKTPLPGWEHLAMNVQYPGLTNRHLREAIRLAINPDQILQGAYAGFNDRATRLIQKGIFGSWDKTPIYNQNIAQAKKLFQQAGSPSTNFEILVITNQAQKTAAEIIAQQLAQVGIQAHARPVDVPTAVAARQGQNGIQNNQLTYWVGVYGPDPADATGIFTCNTVGVSQFQQWCNKQYTRLWDTALHVRQPAARVPSYRTMSYLFDKAAHTVFVAKPTHLYAGVSGIKPVYSGLGFALYHLFKMP